MTHMTLAQNLRCVSGRLVALDDPTEGLEDLVHDPDPLLAKMRQFACITCKAAARG